MNNRPLSVAHLVFGVIFVGIAALWAIAAGTDADSGDVAALVPLVLIGSGLIGLAAIMLNARSARRAAEEHRETYAETYAATHAETHAATHAETHAETHAGGVPDTHHQEDTTVLDPEEQR